MPNEVRLNTTLPNAQSVNQTPTMETPQSPVEDRNALPGASSPQSKDISKLLNLPTLAVPTGPLDLEVLMNSLGFDSRRTACRQGLDSIAANANAQKAENDKAIAQMLENIKKMEEAKKMQDLMKILGVFALVVAAVVTVATLGTAGPVMACISVALLALTITSYATDGAVSIAAGFAKLGEVCGMSEKDSQLFGFIMELVVIIATLGAGIGSSFSKGATIAGAQVAKGAQAAIKTTEAAMTNVSTAVAKEVSKKVISQLNKLAEQAATNTFKLTTGLAQATKVAKEAGGAVGSFAGIPATTVNALVKEGLRVLLPAGVKKAAFIANIIANVAGGGLSIAKGAVSIKAAQAEADAMTARANVKHIDALLLQLREFAEMERAMVKAEIERCNVLVGAVMQLVNSNNDAQARILGHTPAMA